MKRSLPWTIALIILVQGSALAWEAWHLSLTADENSHLAAGYMYWRGEDVLYPSDTPPLTRMTSGWVPRVLHARAPADIESWNPAGTDRLAALPPDS